MRILENKNTDSLMVLAVSIGLIFTMFMNGWSLLTGGETAVLKYLNIYNNPQKDSYPAYFTFLFYIVGILQLGATLSLCYALLKGEFFKGKRSAFLKWGIFLLICSVTLHGFMVRIASNHAGSANLYFYLVILYLLLWYTEQRSFEKSNVLFNKIKILPIYMVLFYSMGFPGWQKIINPQEVMGKYVNMFSNTFLAKLPGGVEPFIYFLGTLEIVVPIFLIISLIKKELSLEKPPVFFNIATLITIVTFIMLSFGLSVLGNYQGSTNLIFYAILTLGLHIYVSNTAMKISNPTLDV